MKKIVFSTLLIALTLLVSSFSLMISFAAQLHGDLNADGSVNSIDFGIFRMHLLGTNKLSDTTAADLNGDGKANSIDFAYLRQYLLGQIKVFPVDSTSTATPTATATPVTTPTPTINPDQWKENTGTINLGTTITYTGTGIQVNGSVVTIASGGDHTVTGTLSDGMIYIDTVEKVKLRLSGVNITNSKGPAIYFANADKAFITITDGTVNYLADGSAYTDEDADGTLFSNDDLEIKGKGTLNITSNYGHGIACDDSISIGNGNISIKAVKDGINANDDVEVIGGYIYINSQGDGIDVGGNINASAGTVIAVSDKKGFASGTALNITGGTLISTGSYAVSPGNTSTQPSLYTSLSSTQASGTLFHIELNGNEILTFAPAKSYQQLFYSSSNLTAGTTYKINIGGSSTGTSKNGLYSGGSYTQGSTNLTATAALIP